MLAYVIVITCCKENVVLLGAFQDNNLYEIWRANRVNYGGLENKG